MRKTVVGCVGVCERVSLCGDMCGLCLSGWGMRFVDNRTRGVFCVDWARACMSIAYLVVQRPREDDADEVGGQQG